MSGGPVETATAQFRVHKTKFKLVRSLDSKEVTTSDTTQLTAVNAGTSSITASIGGVLFPFTASVNEPKLTLSYQGKLAKSVDATSGTVVLTAGESADLNLGYTPRHDYTSLNSVPWASSDASVATVTATSSVSATGTMPKTAITAKTPGTVTITGDLARRTAETTVKVVDATLAIVCDTHQDTADRSDDMQVSVTSKMVEVTPGENFRLYTKITPAHDYASFPSSVTRTTWAEDAHNSVIELRTSGDTANDLWSEHTRPGNRQGDSHRQGRRQGGHDHHLHGQAPAQADHHRTRCAEQ